MKLPRLINEKETLIKIIKKENSKYTNLIRTLSIIFILVITYFIYYSKKQHRYKQKLETLLNTQKEQTNIAERVVVTSDKQSEKLRINKENIAAILKALDSFEENHEYLNKTITIHSLAKKINTNTRYLSKIINHFKQKNFSNYLNNLRIDYAVNKLTNDIQFRKYTIQAIAGEVGFNSAESFSTAFYKKTGIKPSYFIRNIT